LRSMGGEFEDLSGSLCMRLLPIRRGSGHETFLRSIKPLRKRCLIANDPCLGGVDLHFLGVITRISALRARRSRPPANLLGHRRAAFPPGRDAPMPRDRRIGMRTTHRGLPGSRSSRPKCIYGDRS